MQILDAGDSALLALFEPVIDPAVNARAIAVASRLRERRLPGVRDVVPTFRSVAVYFDPLVTEVAALRAALQDCDAESAEGTAGPTFGIPVAYGGDAGPDLEAVAAFAGCTPDEVVRRHAAVTYRVYMLGFLPGFAYLGAVDESIAAPRRATPRARVRKGSIGIAGRQTGIYPSDSPGGWQIIGRTSVDVFDPSKGSPALLAPGDAVRFVPVPASHLDVEHARREGADGPPGAMASPQAQCGRIMTVLRPGLQTTVQDEGRWGHQASGVSVSGAMDYVAHRLANAIVGNPRSAATLEVTLLGPELRFEQRTRVAITGADLTPSLDGVRVPVGKPLECAAGSVLGFGSRGSGSRAYVACDGGVIVPPVLGSRSTHVRSGIGGRPLQRGDRVPLNEPEGGTGARRPSADGAIRDLAWGMARRPGGASAAESDAATLRIMPGPQADLFDDAALEALQDSRYVVSPQSDRMGYRLSGGRAIRSVPGPGMISDAAFCGAVQIPASGEPILLMADRQPTGGYPQIAVVITADLPAAAQLAPGDALRFELCDRAEALAALVAREGRLLAVE